MLSEENWSRRCEDANASGVRQPPGAIASASLSPVNAKFRIAPVGVAAGVLATLTAAITVGKRKRQEKLRMKADDVVAGSVRRKK